MTASGSTGASIRSGPAPARPGAAPGKEWPTRSCLLVRPDVDAGRFRAPQRERADAAAAAHAHADRVVARLAEGDHAQAGALHEADLDQAQRHAFDVRVQRPVRT